VIPRANIIEWSAKAPWPTEADIEQDLILSRLMVEIASDDLLGPELAMRGGTCLHKLHLPSPLRYSDDLDYVRSSRSGVGPYLDALRRIATNVGLAEQSTERRGDMVHITLQTDSTDGLRKIRIKIETNVRETEACFERARRPFHVESRWWSGGAEISTFSIDELISTKLRALYQRSRGRDLFDLWLVLTSTPADPERIVQAFLHYMGAEAFSYPQLAANLAAKLIDRGFGSDLKDLVKSAPEDYDQVTAADIVMERLGRQLQNAPPLALIEGGAWRSQYQGLS
jgi:predicted nucleotidyltransferase component of viral defense system